MKTKTITHPDGTQTIEKTEGGCGKSCAWLILVTLVVGGISSTGAGPVVEAVVVVGGGLLAIWLFGIGLQALVNKSKHGKI